MQVPQDAIADPLGVRRRPVREALIVLEREGWVSNEMHTGRLHHRRQDEPKLDYLVARACS
jgi:DNA-binding FadR family transcriptional regulator